MRHRNAAILSLLLGVSTAVSAQPTEHNLDFDANRYVMQSATVDGRAIEYRAYEGIVYVRQPVDVSYQRMNVFVPAAYFDGGAVGGYDAASAPIFLPNSVGGYMPARPGAPGARPDGMPNAALLALSKGYVVAWPGARGRTLQDAAGQYTGKAPAVIVDLKAAVRYLRFNDARMPGNAEQIVSNGTSAGGAVSALLGASGNHPDYEPFLRAVGAADARDDIFAVSAYCPITNLEHADMAYEWQFVGVNDFTRFTGRPPTGPRGPGAAPPTGGMPPAGLAPPPGASAPSPRPPQGTMTPEQVRLSGMLAPRFPAYVNALGLVGRTGQALTLDASGNGPFKDHVASYLAMSAQRVIADGTNIAAATWLTIVDGNVRHVDFAGYAGFATRMKVTPAFDGLDLSSPENDLFGNATTKARHFTAFGQEHASVPATMAEPARVRMMNAMTYVGAPQATTARYWRIRHGSIDRDTSLAIPVILATKLENTGRVVDFALPWGQGHGGDYDLTELFEWIGRVCGRRAEARARHDDRSVEGRAARTRSSR